MTSSTDYLIYVVGTEVCYQLAKETGTDVALHACMSVWVWTDKGVCVRGMPDNDLTATCGLNFYLYTSCSII